MDDSYKYFFMRFIRPHATIMSTLIVLSFTSTLFSLVTPILEKSLVDDVFIGRRTDLLGYILIATAGIYIVSSLSTFFSSYKKGKLDLILFNDVANEAFNSIQIAPIMETQEMKVGDLLSRIVVNTRSAINMFTFIIPEFIINSIRVITPVIIMLFLDMKLAIVVIIPALLFLVPMIFFGKRLEDTQRTSLAKTAEIYSFLKENLSMIPLIKVFGLERWSQSKFNEQMKDYYDASMDYTKNSSLNSSVESLMFGVPMILLILLGSPMVMNGSLTIGTFTAFMSYIALFFAPIRQFSFLWSFYKSSSPAFDRVNKILKLENDNGGEKELAIKDGSIEFEDVWFSYNSRSILCDFSANFRKGLNYIVGDNGVGKSTILKLLCSLYPLERGHIKIDGQDISNIKKLDLRKKISMIFSEPYLFDGSIYENIHIGSLSASKEEVIHAAKQVSVHEFVISLSQGYETQVGENGLKLSSGEKQKIALARAVLKNSPIILLDEVTKSIDADSRRSINEVIKRLKNEKTIIIITHNTNEIERGSNVVYLGKDWQKKDYAGNYIDVTMSKNAFS